MSCRSLASPVEAVKPTYAAAAPPAAAPRTSAGRCVPSRTYGSVIGSVSDGWRAGDDPMMIVERGAFLTECH